MLVNIHFQKWQFSCHEDVALFYRSPSSRLCKWLWIVENDLSGPCKERKILFGECFEKVSLGWQKSLEIWLLSRPK